MKKNINSFVFKRAAIVEFLDCCAAGGAYAFPLKEGYKVTAGDLIQNHVDILNTENKDGLLEYVCQDNVLDMPD